MLGLDFSEADAWFALPYQNFMAINCMGLAGRSTQSQLLQPKLEVTPESTPTEQACSLEAFLSSSLSRLYASTHPSSELA